MVTSRKEKKPWRQKNGDIIKGKEREREREHRDGGGNLEHRALELVCGLWWEAMGQCVSRTWQAEQADERDA